MVSRLAAIRELRGGANGNPFRPGIDETTSVPSVGNPYSGYYNYYGSPYYGAPYYVGPGFGGVYRHGYTGPGWR